jgi:hypothetical protein
MFLDALLLGGEARKKCEAGGAVSAKRWATAVESLEKPWHFTEKCQGLSNGDEFFDSIVRFYL